MDKRDGPQMDERRDARYGLKLPATVTVLGSPHEVRFAATIRNASGRGLALETPEPIARGAALKVEMEDALLLGEAVYCRKELDGYVVGLELDQVLNGLAELNKKLREFSDEPLVRQP